LAPINGILGAGVTVAAAVTLSNLARLLSVKRRLGLWPYNQRVPQACRRREPGRRRRLPGKACADPPRRYLDGIDRRSCVPGRVRGVTDGLRSELQRPAAPCCSLESGPARGTTRGLSRVSRS
jgi:hypothetical protein